MPSVWVIFWMRFAKLRNTPPTDAIHIWSDAIGFRIVLAHQYFGIDPDAVWEVVDRDLPELKRMVVEAGI